MCEWVPIVGLGSALKLSWRLHVAWSLREYQGCDHLGRNAGRIEGWSVEHGSSCLISLCVMYSKVYFNGNAQRL